MRDPGVCVKLHPGELSGAVITVRKPGDHGGIIGAVLAGRKKRADLFRGTRLETFAQIPVASHPAAKNQALRMIMPHGVKRLGTKHIDNRILIRSKRVIKILTVKGFGIVPAKFFRMIQQSGFNAAETEINRFSGARAFPAAPVRERGNSNRFASPFRAAFSMTGPPG